MKALFILLALCGAAFGSKDATIKPTRIQEVSLRKVRIEHGERLAFIEVDSLTLPGCDFSGCFFLSDYRGNCFKFTVDTMLDSPRHQCFVYEGAPSSHLADVARTLIRKLNANHRCLYLNSPPMVAGMRWHLAAAGLDVQEQMERSALVLLSDQAHLRGEKFDVDKMLGLLRDGVNQALADGYVGLWASGDMTWEFGSEANLDKLLDYEQSLDEFMQYNPALSGICLYHRDTLPAHAIQTALLTHPSLYMSAALSQINPLYYQHLPKRA